MSRDESAQARPQSSQLTPRSCVVGDEVVVVKTDRLNQTNGQVSMPHIGIVEHVDSTSVTVAGRRFDWTKNRVFPSYRSERPYTPPANTEPVRGPKGWPKSTGTASPHVGDRVAAIFYAPAPHALVGTVTMLDEEQVTLNGRPMLWTDADRWATVDR